MKELLDFLVNINTKPPLFEAGELKFWDDPHISKKMLEAHLNPNHDAASRKPQTIEKTVRHLFESKVIKPGMKVLDLGCGPGLYAESLFRAGAKVTGLDISERSIEYARKHAEELKLNIEYHCMNFLKMDYEEEFDVVIQIYGEICTFSSEARNDLMKKVHRALKKDGIFVFDVSTREQRAKDGLKNHWYISNGGFWRPEKHLVLEHGYDYPEEDVWLDQYMVIDDHGIKVYRNWFHDYTIDSIRNILITEGFETKYVWNDLTGSHFTQGGDWIAVGAVKIPKY